MKLQKLTKEQEAFMPVIRDKWIDIALHNDKPVDSEAFRQGVAFIYELAKLPPPAILIVDSPLGIQFAHNLLRNFPDIENSVWNSVRNSVWDSVWDSVRNSVWNSVRDSVRNSVWNSVWNSVGNSVENSVWNSVGNSVENSVWNSVGNSVENSVRNSVWNSVWNSVGNSVGNSVWNSVGNSVENSVWNSVGNSEALAFETFSWLDLMWSGWVAFYDYFTEIEILNDGKFQQYKKYLEAGGAFTVLFEGIAITSNRPIHVRQDDQARLHCDSDSAIKWRDGFELYFLDGVELQKDQWEQIVSQTMAFDEILKIEDSDIRAVALKYNKNAIIASGAELLDEHPTAGELFLIENKEINKILDEPKLYFLRMKCPTGRTFIEAVEPKYAAKHPYALHCQANAWGISADLYGRVVNHG